MASRRNSPLVVATGLRLVHVGAALPERPYAVATAGLPLFWWRKKCTPIRKSCGAEVVPELKTEGNENSIC